MQSLPSWHDRKAVKESIEQWLSTKKFCFLLTLTDIQEIQDIEEWIDGHKAYSIAHIYFDTDTVASKYNLLEQIRDEFAKSNFPKFNKYDLLSSGIDLPNFKQSIGEGSSSQGDQEYERISQVMNIENIDPVALKHNIKESVANKAFTNLLEDMNELQKKKPLLLVVRFLGDGFEKLSKDFNSWFQYKFLRDLSKLPRIKICLLCQKTHGDLTAHVEVAHQYKVDELHFDEISIFANQFIENAEMFCRGMVEPHTQHVEYRTFKSRLFSEIQRQQLLKNVG